jgi:hypothetical protein
VQDSAKKTWGLSGAEQGAIASIFTIGKNLLFFLHFSGFMCMSPIWAHFGMRYRVNVHIH